MARPGSRLDDDRDEALVAACVAGDLEAFNELVRRHETRVYRVCLRVLGNRADAEDAAQEALVHAWRQLGSFHGRSSLSTWLYRIAVNRCLMELRTRRSRPPSQGDAEARELSDRRDDPVLHAEAAATMGTVMAAVPCLSPDQRIVVVLSHLEGCTYREVADIVGVSEAAVKSRLNRARSELLVALRRQGVDVTVPGVGARR